MTALAERLRIALDLWETGVILRRRALCREHPELSAAQIEALVNQWLATRPGAEKGDGPQPWRLYPICVTIGLSLRSGLDSPFPEIQLPLE